ncbi:MAG: FtsW/RodA/SpoVE family cell cycle protein [Candidatus Microsaccharimonas sp.]
MASGWRQRRVSGDNGEVVRKHHPDRLILVFTLILMLIGLLMMYAIGPQRANLLNSVFGYEYSDTYFFVKQFISFLLAGAAFALMARIPYEFVLKNGNKVLIAGFIACALLAVVGWAGLGIGQATNGATRWFNLGPLGSIQPAEILKLGLLLYFSVFLAIRYKQGLINDLKQTLIPVGVLTGAALLIVIVIQKDLGTGIAMTAIVATMLFVAGISKKIIFGLVGLLLVAGTVLIVTSPHRMERVATYLQGDNTSTSDDDSYHIEHAKIAIGSGGLFGVGIGKSVQASGYLPEALNDSIFAVMGEMFGFVGLVAILAVFIALLMRLLGVMDHLVDIRLKLAAAGVFGWIGSHVILNIAAMIGIFPLTGITLPLLSYGGTSMIFVTAALGFVYQLSRYTVHPSRIKEEDNEDSRSRRGLGRARHTSRRSA